MNQSGARATAGSSRIAILTAASLSWNPRALKEAITLARSGFEVIVFGAVMNADQLSMDTALADQHGFTFQSVVGLKDRGVKRVFSILPRIRSRIARYLDRYLGIESSWQLGPGVRQLAERAREWNADYHLVHLEPALWAGVQLGRSGRQVGLDLEDWYSEDLLPEARKTRPLRLLRALERKLLTTSAHVTCPSRAMSQAVASEFGCPAPIVIYNAFAWSERKFIDGLSKDRSDLRVPSIHWFSQTLGHGRGLEDLLAAIPLLEYDSEIHLRGNPVSGFENWLSARVSKASRSRIVIHPPVPNKDLLSRIAEHDIGFAGEMRYCRNKELTVSNKILYYLLGGLAVVASDTRGQREVAEQAPGAVVLYPSGDASELAGRLNQFLGSEETLSRAKVAALNAAKATFCWEHQEKALLNSLAQALAS